MSFPKIAMKSRGQVEQEAQQQAQQAQTEQQQTDVLGAAEVVNKVTPAVLGIANGTGR